MLDEQDIPADLLERIADWTGDDRKRFLEDVRAVDPDFRARVRAALEEKGETVDPFFLEMALASGISRSQRREEWAGKEQKKEGDDVPVGKVDEETGKAEHTIPRRAPERVKRFLKETLSELQSMPRNEWREHFFYAYDNMDFSGDDYAWGLRRSLTHGPSWDESMDGDLQVDSYLGMLEAGEDPATVLAMLVNEWGNRTAFLECASAFKNTLVWSDDRSIVYRHHFAKARENPEILCDEITIEPAGLALLEPFTGEQDFHYDIYGGLVADVTIYALAFRPRMPSQSKALQRRVEKAIRGLMKTELPIRVPTDRWSELTKRTYKRPEMFDHEDGGMDDQWVDWLARMKVQDEALFNVYENFFKAMNIKEMWKRDVSEEARKGSRDWNWNHCRHACDYYEQLGRFPEGTPEHFVLLYELEALRLERQTFTTIESDGRVALRNRLVLDDVWDLYKLCGGFVEPCEQIAIAMNTARYSEERGPLKRLPDLDQRGFGVPDHEYGAWRTSDEFGNLHNVPLEDRLIEGMAHVGKMLGSRSIDESTATMQLMQLADGTLKGALHDPTGFFPTYTALTDQRAGGAVVEYSEALADRSRVMADAMAMMFGERNRSQPLKERFARAVKNAGKVAAMEATVQDAVESYRSSKRWSAPSRDLRSSFEALIGEDRMAKKLTDILTGRVGQFPEWDEDTDPGNEGDEPVKGDSDKAKEGEDEDEGYEPAPPGGSGKTLVNRGDLMRWEGSVAPQVDRTYEGTWYTTRSKHSPFVRLEMPDDLQPFVRRWEQRQGRERFQLPDPKTIFDGPRRPQPF